MDNLEGIMPIQQAYPLFIINAVAPIRICDNGGWTDTWFAKHGVIFNIGVSPYVEVQIAVYLASQREHRILINAENYGAAYIVEPEAHASTGLWGPHPLLEAAIEYMHLPENLAFEITLYSDAPVGLQPEPRLRLAWR
jgi:D-glycero-alpha-D-manno-heptose-7-phosphate kinase